MWSCDGTYDVTTEITVRAARDRPTNLGRVPSLNIVSGDASAIASTNTAIVDWYFWRSGCDIPDAPPFPSQYSSRDHIGIVEESHLRCGSIQASIGLLGKRKSA
jgi:hypothetical protein